MKIEKISENQIRCTLSHQDLIERELKISELAYGSEKTRTLFKDMMQQASYEFGFEADNIPLMIEAIPVSMETLMNLMTDSPDFPSAKKTMTKVMMRKSVSTHRCWINLIILPIFWIWIQMKASILIPGIWKIHLY